MFLLSRGFRISVSFFLVFAGTAFSSPILIHGKVSDPSGAIITSARVELIHNDTVVLAVTTDPEGRYSIHRDLTGESRIRVSSPGFATIEKTIAAENRMQDLTLDISLPLASFSEQITVTSTGTPTPQSQLGATVTSLTETDYQGTRDLQEGLRLVPGLQAVQTGQAGGTTSLFIRGGGDDANKVLIDGIPANDIGGFFEFANLSSAAIGHVEVLRGPNSVLYGSDALAGVISFTTPQGHTLLPLFTYSIDGGDFGTYHQAGTFSGVYSRFDYFSDYSRFDTRNSVPEDSYHNGTFAGSYGWMFSPKSYLRATVHHDQVASGAPNAIELYGIPTEAKQVSEDSYFGVTWDDQSTTRWHNVLRYGGVRLRSNFTEFAPTGIPQYIDLPPANTPVLVDYLGAPVTIHGANGYTVSGQAVYQYVQTYPNSFPNLTDTDSVYAQSDYRFKPYLLGLFAFRYQDERGYSSGPTSSVQRGNSSYTLELQGNLRNRLFYTLGGGLENNGLFGFAGTPRISLAWQVARGSAGGLAGGTKLRASYGEGIKEPSILDQTTSLLALLQGLPEGEQLASEYHVGAIGAARSKSYEGGIDQMFENRRGRASLTVFHNQFSDGIEYIPQPGLIELGVPSPVAAAALFGATVNSQAYRAEGVESEMEYQITNNLLARGGYTYLDARIQRSFSSDALGPSFNPNFPTVPIGIYSPLIGARPFRRAPHTGYFELGWRAQRFFGALRGTLVGARDDSDFLPFDANGGSSLLLPNRNLDGAYQRIDLTARYQINRYLAAEGNAQNLTSQHYHEAFGYPALPFMFRLGLKFSLGGESWPGR
jgi:iron complex outermembrane receptor protein/vitamin B12 transporter